MNFLRYILLALFMASSMLTASGSPLGTLKFKYNGKLFNFGEAAAAVQVKNGMAQLSIAGIDRAGGREFALRSKFSVESKIPEMFLDIENSNLVVTLKQASGDNFSLMPRYQLLKAHNLTYRGQRKADRKHRLKRRKGKNNFTPEWRHWSKAKRLKYGRGIIHNGAMAGSSFSLHLIPIYENGRLIKIKGKFSGLVGRAAKSRKFKRNVKITFGEFYLEVAQP